MYFNLQRISPKRQGSWKGLLLGGLLIGTAQQSIAQCNPTEYYDQLMSSYHSTIAHNTDGTYSIWGQATKQDGSANHTSPVVITAGTGTNQYNFSGTILKMSLASTSANFQGFMLTTSALYTWGSVNAVTTAGAFHTVGMPSGVAVTDVNIMTATNYGLFLVTNSGNVWVRGENNTYSYWLYGDNSTAANTSWHQVKTDAAGTTALSGITQIAVSGSNGVMAYAGSTGKWYTWGRQVYKGDATGAAGLKYAEEMTAPFSGAPKMIECTGFGSSNGLSYYALNASDGKIYTLGDNTSYQLGNGTNVTATSWTNVLAPGSGSTALSNVIFISANQHDPQNASVAAIVSSGDLYLWGSNPKSMLGAPVSSTSVTRPRIPDGFTSGTDKCLYVEVGGHTSVYVKDGNKKYCYVGHKYQGSMGDGTSVDDDVATFDCSSTANARICGATSFDGGDVPASYEGAIVGFHDIVDNITTLYLGKTPPTFNNNNFRNVAAGADNTGANGDGWEEDALSGAPNYFNTGSFSTTIRLKNTTGAAKNLYAWVDWNNNGTFETTERITRTVNNNDTTAVLSWTSVPTTLVRNVKYYMRIRLTSSTLTNANDYAIDGELEDFFVKMPVYLPVAANISTSMSNNSARTTIPSLNGSEPEGRIDSFRITTLPPATQGTLYLCAPTCTAIPAGTTLSYADRGKLAFLPNTGYTGVVNFTYQSIDSNKIASSAAVYTITTTNQPPVANNVANTTIAAGVSSRVKGLKGFDADGTVEQYTVTAVPNAATEGTLRYCSTPPATGCGTAVAAGTNLTPAQAQTLTFTPVASYSGTLNIPYTVTDNNSLLSNTGYLSIPVKTTASDDMPPVADNILNPTISNNSAATPLAPLNGTDMRGAIAVYTITSLPSATAGTLYLCDPSCVAVTVGQTLTTAQKSKLQFAPLATFTGTATFNYTVTNDHSTPSVSASATVTIPVGNKAPVAEHLVYNAVGRNADNTKLSPLSASDADGTINNYTIQTLPAVTEGVLYLCTTPPATGCTPVTAGQTISLANASKLTFKPAAGFLGTADFTYTATDNNSNVSPAAHYNIVVNTDPAATGNPPVTQNLAAATSSGTTVALPSLIGSDPDGDLKHYVIAGLPPTTEGRFQFCSTPGTCADLSAGQQILPADISKLRFVPATGFIGMSTLSYYAVDNNFNQSNLSDAKVAVTNVPPVAVDITAPKQVNTAGAATLPALSASDADGTVASYVITSLPDTSEGVLRLCTTAPATGCAPVTAGQVLTPAQSANLTFTPKTTFTGYSKFGYTAIDNNGNIGNAAKMTIAAGSIESLPLDLISFDATAKACTAELSWTTASTSTVAAFAVQVGEGANGFRTAGVVAAGGNYSYRFAHNMQPGTQYQYRLEFRFIDGTTGYSATKRLSCNGNAQATVSLAPNPVKDVLQLNGVPVGATILLMSADGQLLQTLQAGQVVSGIDMRPYSNGVYLIRISTPEGYSSQHKIMKQ